MQCVLESYSEREIDLVSSLVGLLESRTVFLILDVKLFNKVIEEILSFAFALFQHFHEPCVCLLCLFHSCVNLQMHVYANTHTHTHTHTHRRRLEKDIR